MALIYCHSFLVVVAWLHHYFGCTIKETKYKARTIEVTVIYTDVFRVSSNI